VQMLSLPGRLLPRAFLSLTISLFLGLVVHGQNPTPQAAPPTGSTPPAKSAPSAKGIHDIISMTFSATCKGPDEKSPELEWSAVKPDLDKLAQQEEIDWAGSQLLVIANRAKMSQNLANVDLEQAYIFHVNHWTPAHVLVSSDWFAYKGAKRGKLKPSGFTPSGDQLLYGLKRALIVGIEIIDGGKSGGLTFDYKISAVQGTPENTQAMAQLIAALLGLATGSSFNVVEQAVPIGCSILAGAAFQNGTKRLPFDLNVAESAYDPNKTKDSGSDPTKGTALPAGVTDCSTIEKGSPCTLTRTFTSLDKEWWDVGIGVSIPGVRETKYSLVSGVLTPKATTHTDAYALFDIYPFARCITKDSGVPHLAVGLPVTGQTFYRPFFGISENLIGWNGIQKLTGLPTLNFFAGVVYMKTSIVTGSPTTPAQFTSDQHYVRVTKAVFGVEVPVKAVHSIGRCNTI
jgi:hypothetical protein